MNKLRGITLGTCFAFEILIGVAIATRQTASSIGFAWFVFAANGILIYFLTPTLRESKTEREKLPESHLADVCKADCREAVNPIIETFDVKRVDKIFADSLESGANSYDEDWGISTSAIEQIEFKCLSIQRREVLLNRSKYTIFIRTTNGRIIVGTEKEWIVNGPWVNGLNDYFDGMENEIVKARQERVTRRDNLIAAAAKEFERAR